MIYSPMLTAALISFPLLFGGSTVLAETQTTTTDNKTNELHAKLLGAWAFAGKPDSKEDPKPGATLKIFGHKHFVIVRSDPDTGEVLNCHGGTYKLEGETYTGKIEFASEKRKFMIGRTVKLKIKIDGDVFIQEGIGNNFNERWIKQKPK